MSDDNLASVDTVSRLNDYTSGFVNGLESAGNLLRYVLRLRDELLLFDQRLTMRSIEVGGLWHDQCTIVQDRMGRWHDCRSIDDVLLDYDWLRRWVDYDGVWV